FFFQAEDGIRDFHVTGVQTCALPISCTMKKRWGPLTLVLLALMLVLAACGQPSSDAGGTEENAAETGEGDEATSEGDESVTIGINQLVEHPSLDAAREGFMQAFADNGY